MAQVIFVVIEIVGPTDNELAGEDSKCDDICGALPPVVVGENPTDGGDDKRGAEVTSLAKTFYSLHVPALLSEIPTSAGNFASRTCWALVADN